MNLWECEECRKNTVVGLGTAFGLRAIGWYVFPRMNNAPLILCPGCVRPRLGLEWNGEQWSAPAGGGSAASIVRLW